MNERPLFISGSPRPSLIFFEELRQSIQGYQLYVDDALPGIWDFTTDVVVLTDEDGNPLREALRLRGQSKFIWMTTLPDEDVSALVRIRFLSQRGSKSR